MKNKKYIAVISLRFIDFEAYVADVYKAAKRPKSRLRLGKKISIEENGLESVFVFVQHLFEIRGKRFDDKVVLFGADALLNFDKIIREIEMTLDNEK